MQPPLKFLDFSNDYIIELAKTRGYEYSEVEASDGKKSSLYNNETTNTHELHRLSMSVEGIKCSYYTAAYQDPHFKSATYQVQVFEISLPYEVEDLYISSRTNVTLTNILGLSNVSFNAARQVMLEGGFNQFFKVFTPKNEELTAFTILAPNIMERLLESASDYDVEFSGNKVYFYQVFKYFTEGVITLKKQGYDDLLEFGLISAKKMTRAGRPAQRIKNALNTPMWRLYGQKNAQRTIDTIKVIIGFIIISFCLVVPIFWPVFLLILIIFLYRWRSLVVKRNKLISSFNGDYKFAS